MSLLLAIGLMVLVVVPLVGWAVWADRRRRLEADEPSGAESEEVA